MSGNASTYKNFTGLAGLVEAWSRGSLANNGLVLKQVGEDVNNVIWFNSSAGTNKPKLYVTYSTDVPASSEGSTYYPLPSPQHLIQTNSTIPAGGVMSTQVGTLAGMPADLTNLGTLAIRAEVDGWTSPGTIEFTNVGDYSTETVPVIFGQAGDIALEGVGVTALVAASVDGVVHIRNTSPAAVRLSVRVLGYYPFQDLAPSDDVTSGPETDPFMDHQIGTRTQLLDSANADTGPTDDCPADPNYDESTATQNIEQEAQLISCTAHDSAPLPLAEIDRQGSVSLEDSANDSYFGRGSASLALTNQGSCWPSTIDPDTWVSKRYESCNVTRLTIRLKKIINAAGATKEVGRIKIALWRMVQLGQTNTKLSASQQLSWVSCSGAGCSPGLVAGASAVMFCESSCGSSSGSQLMSVTKSDKKSGVYEHEFAAPLASSESVRAVTVDGTWDVKSVAPFQDVSPQMNLHGSPYIRCDNMSYFSQSAGCVFRAFKPVFQLDTADTAVDTAASHIAWAQSNRYPWGLTSAPLRRGNPSLTEKNRKAACANFKKTMSCDEFPFASTTQGCYTHASYCSVRDIPRSDNVTAGARLGAFYRRARIMRDTDYFLVNIK